MAYGFNCETKQSGRSNVHPDFRGKPAQKFTLKQIASVKKNDFQAGLIEIVYTVKIGT